MNTGDKVRIIDGYYKGQEGHIEGIKDGQFIVALSNDDGCVNTIMPAKRLEIIREEEQIEYSTPEIIIKNIISLLIDLSECIRSTTNKN